MKIKGLKGYRLSIDWIHNLVYFNENKKIIVFNMITKYEYVVIEVKEEELITDLSVISTDSIIFYSIYNWIEKNGTIMKSSQDGSNRTLLRDIGNDSVLSIDLVERKVFWCDTYFIQFFSVDFEGNNFLTYQRLHSFYNLNPFTYIEKFGQYIYWTESGQKYIIKAKLGLNDTQMDYLITSETNYFGSFKIIDASLQPNSTNRCINAICSHLCIPISTDQYRCVCPQNDNEICRESVSILKRYEFSTKKN
jgi:hypothetical protein